MQKPALFVRMLFMVETEPRNYEIAYLLSPNVPEEEVLTYSSKLTALIEDNKAVVKYVETPKKRKLSFPIKKERNAYFGWATFSSSPENLKDIGNKIKVMDGLLRYLIVEKEKREPLIRPMRQLRTEHTAAQPTGIPEEKLDLEALDKKLEEILGK